MRRYAPAFALFFLSPLLAEVLFGATTITHWEGFVPVTLLYGGGALLIRELARRRDAGWARIALLGIAYAIVEEGVAIQSLFNPTLFQAAAVGGRALGVNWVWTEWTIGYHILWSLIIPILMSELLFPSRRTEPWLGRLGVVITTGCYVLGTFAVAMVFRKIVAPNFRAPAILMGIAVALAVGFMWFALAWPKFGVKAKSPATQAPSPWLAAVVAFVAAVAWFGLLIMPDALRKGARVLLPMLLAAAIAVGVTALLRQWSVTLNWSDQHRLAAALGAMAVSMAFGFFAVTAGNRIDHIGQGVACLIAIVLFGVFAVRVRTRTIRAEAAHNTA